MSAPTHLVDLVVRAANHLEDRSPYGYRPAKAPGIAYIACFAFLLLLHVALGVRYKYWVVFVTLIPGALLEVIGWAGRLWSAYHPNLANPFLMQICCLILAPAFFSGFCYTVLGFCITRLGAAYSLLKPKMYLAVFVTADIISLVLQAIGGGKAAVAARLGTNTKPATKIMLAGILFQLVTMTVFTVLALDFIIRVILHRPYAHLAKRAASLNSADTSNNNLPTSSNTTTEKTTTPSALAPGDVTPAELRRAEYLLAGVAFASLMIYVRGVYRSVELAQGWSGYLITHEVFFIYLDGLPMVLCLAAFAVAHPGFLLRKRQGWRVA